MAISQGPDVSEGAKLQVDSKKFSEKPAIDLMASTAFLSEVADVEQKAAQWYAVYTSSRHEKVVARQLQDRSIETFLPLYRTWHRWKDRRKLVELPLFPSYVFVRIDAKRRLRVL